MSEHIRQTANATPIVLITDSFIEKSLTFFNI